MYRVQTSAGLGWAWSPEPAPRQPASSGGGGQVVGKATRRSSGGGLALSATEPWCEPPARGISEVFPVQHRPRSPGWMGGTEPTLAGDAADPGVKLSILMPAFNEQRTIVLAVPGGLQTPYPRDLGPHLGGD